MKLSNLLLICLLFSGSANADYINLLNKLKEVAGGLQNSNSAKAFKTFGLTGSWSINCQNVKSIITYNIENNEMVMRYKTPDTPNYSVIQNAQLIDDTKLLYTSQVFSTIDDQPIRKINGMFVKKEGKISLFYLEIIADGKTVVRIKDGLSTGDGSKSSHINKCKN